MSHYAWFARADYTVIGLKRLYVSANAHAKIVFLKIQQANQSLLK